jgi:hypothetical protein
MGSFAIRAKERIADVETHVAAIRAFGDAGFDEIAVVQFGTDQEGFLRFWRDELRDRGSSSPAPTPEPRATRRPSR